MVVTLVQQYNTGEKPTVMLTLRTPETKQKHFLYWYIYICVCVCVCVLGREKWLTGNII